MAVRGRAACEGPRGTSVAIGAPARLGEVRGVRVTGTYGACPVCERRFQWRCSECFWALFSATCGGRGEMMRY